MMRFLMAMFCAGVGCLLAGCWTVYETPAVALDRSQKFDLNLRLEGFTLTTLQQTGFSSSTANATAYDWQTNSTVNAFGTSKKEGEEKISRIGKNFESLFVSETARAFN